MNIQVRPRQLSAINIIIIEFIRRISAENIFKQGNAASTSALIRACRIFDSCRIRAGPTYRVAASSRFEGAPPSGVVVVAASYSSATPPAKPLAFVLQGSQFYAPPRMVPVAAPNSSARSGRRWARPLGGPGYPHLIPVTPQKGADGFSMRPPGRPHTFGEPSCPRPSSQARVHSR